MRIRLWGAVAVALWAAGCSSTQQLGEILGGVLNAPASSSTVAGEVTYIDTRNQQIQIRTSSNQTGSVFYDQNTRVIYNNREYSVTALERGDWVSVNVQAANNNQLYATQITVTQSVQDRAPSGTTPGSAGDALQRLEGTVSALDRTRGTFEFRSGGNITTAVLHYNVSSSVRDYYNRLRVGDYVRIEGRWIGQNQVSVERFY